MCNQPTLQLGLRSLRIITIAVGTSGSSQLSSNQIPDKHFLSSCQPTDFLYEYSQIHNGTGHEYSLTRPWACLCEWVLWPSVGQPNGLYASVSFLPSAKLKLRPGLTDTIYAKHLEQHPLNNACSANVGDYYVSLRDWKSDGSQEDTLETQVFHLSFQCSSAGNWIWVQGSGLPPICYVSLDKSLKLSEL